MIKPTMSFMEVIRTHPEVIRVFESFGLDCSECQMAEYEDIAQGAHVHGIDVELLVRELNRAIGSQS